jgi:Ankyrin repeats (many copies)
VDEEMPSGRLSLLTFLAIYQVLLGTPALSKALDDWYDALEPMGFEYTTNRPLRILTIRKRIDNLIMHGKSVNARDERGNTPLMLSISGTGDAAPFLIARGADINASNEIGVTPLIFALTAAYYAPDSRRSKQSLEFSRLIIELAAKDCDGELVTLMLQKGANPLARDKKGFDAKKYAEKAKCRQAVAAIKLFKR